MRTGMVTTARERQRVCRSQMSLPPWYSTSLPRRPSLLEPDPTPPPVSNTRRNRRAPSLKL
eukprot:1577241-Rhodomonas_salina.2